MNTLIPRIGVSALASPLEVGADRAPQAQEDLAALLKSQGMDVVAFDSPTTSLDACTAAGRYFVEQHVDAMCLVTTTWFEDYLVLDMIEECDVPVMLWSLPGMETGALCGTQQLTCYLKQLAKPYACAFGSLESGRQLERCKSFLRATALKQRLRRVRIGAVGTRVYGMTESSPNEMSLKKVLGPRVVTVDLLGLLDRASKCDDVEIRKVWDRVKCSAAKVEVENAEGLTAASLYLAIREVVKAEGLSALAFGCYPDYMGRACLAASLLADEGIPVGCEGDVNAAVAMLILQYLTGQPTHNTDWLDPMPDGSVVFSHCGSGSYTLAENQNDIALAHVRLAHQGVCSLFPARPGPVTLVNLVPQGDRYQMAVMEGEAIATDMVFPGNPLRVRFSAPTDRIIDWIHDEGIGHHWMAGYGHVQREIDDLARIIGRDLHYVTR